MAKYVQTSFARGIKSSHSITRRGLDGYSDSVRELFNMGIGRQGEAFRRAGTAIMAVFDETPARIVPFKAADRSYLLIFFPGDFDVPSGTDLESTDRIRIIDLEDFSFSQKPTNFSSSDFLSSTRCKIYGSGVENNIRNWESYWQDLEDGFTADELKEMDFVQLENLMVFVAESFPPFYIRREEDEDGDAVFVYYRSGVDLIANGDDDSSDESFHKAIRSLPFSFYGYRLHIDRATEVSRQSDENAHIRFEGRLELEGTHDSAGLRGDNLKLWRERAFIVAVIGDVSSITENADADIGIQIFNGIFKEVKTDNRSGVVSKYFVSGFLHAKNNNFDLDNFTGKYNNLYICDWAPRLGWPRSCTVFENRFIFFGTEAYPNKIWFSAQPGIQRVQIGNKEEVSVASGNRAETRVTSPIFRTLYFDQLDLFNVDAQVTGLLPQQPSSSGSNFINDRKGFSGYWVRGGEVLFIGTDIGIFVSRGTIAENNNPIPFNSGFIHSIKHPVKRVFPEIVDEDLYFISNDNAVQVLEYNRNKNGFVTRTLDSFSREVIRDISERKTVRKSVNVERLEYNPARDEGEGGGMRQTVLAKRSTGISLHSVDADQITYYNESRNQEGFLVASAFRMIKDPDVTVAVQNRLFTRSVLLSTELLEIDDAKTDDGDDLSDAAKNTLVNSLYQKTKDLSGDNKLKFNNRLFLIGASAQMEGRLWYSSTRGNSARFSISISILKKRGGSLPEFRVGSQIGRFEVIYQPGGDNWLGNPGPIARWNSFLKGSILGNTDGYLSNNVQNNSDVTNSSRLCGVDRRSARTLRLYFDKASTEVSNVQIFVTGSDGDTQAFLGALGVSSGNIRASSEFGRENKQVYYYDINTTVDIPASAAKITIKSVENAAAPVGTVYGETQISLENDSGTWKFRDDLLNPASGDFDIQEDSFELFSRNSRNPNPPQLVNSYALIRAYYAQNIQALASDLTFTFGDPSELSASGARGATGVPREEGPRGQQSQSTSASFSVVDQQSIPKDYPVFNSRTRLRYDWTQRALYFIRDDEEAKYLLYTMDRETGVAGWSRGKMSLSDAVFVNSPDFKPPERLSMLVGLRGTNLVGLPAPLIARKDRYVSNLPNCLDEHIIVQKGANIDLANLKTRLKALGYKDGDQVILGSEDGSIWPENWSKSTLLVSELAGSIRGVRGDNFIVGKPFESILTGWYPLVQGSFGDLFGMVFHTTQLALHVFKNTECNINGDRVAKINNAHVPVDVYGAQFLRHAIQTHKDYDPIFELRVNNPFPFSIGGYIQSLKVATKGTR